MFSGSHKRCRHASEAFLHALEIADSDTELPTQRRIRAGAANIVYPPFGLRFMLMRAASSRAFPSVRVDPPAARCIRRTSTGTDMSRALQLVAP